MGVFKRTKEAFERGASGNDVYDIAGVRLVCSHCDHDHFDHDQFLLNSRSMSFMGLDWANASADVYVCKRCGHIEWFVQR